MWQRAAPSIRPARQPAARNWRAHRLLHQGHVFPKPLLGDGPGVLGSAKRARTGRVSAPSQSLKSSGTTTPLLIKPPVSAAELDAAAEKTERLMMIPAVLGGIVLGWGIGKLYNKYVRDVQPSFEEIQAKADAGDSTMQFTVGMAYHLGQNDVEQSNEKALEYFQLSAAQDDPQGLYCLGIYTMAGTCMKEGADETKALGYFKKAAELGLSNAQLQLAKCLLEGIGCPVDPSAGVEWLRKAAEGNSHEAKFTLGLCYETGHGVEQDLAAAVQIFTELGDLPTPYGDALLHLGQAHFKGEGGLPVDKAKAVEIWGKAAERGTTAALYLLGSCYMQGEGVEVDMDTAKKYFEGSAAMGDMRSTMALAMMEQDGDAAGQQAEETSSSGGGGGGGDAVGEGGVSTADAQQLLAQLRQQHAAAGGGMRDSAAGTVPAYDFEAADAFKGAKQGWAFKMGDNGLGYYREYPDDPDKDDHTGR